MPGNSVLASPFMLLNEQLLLVQPVGVEGVMIDPSLKGCMLLRCGLLNPVCGCYAVN